MEVYKLLPSIFTTLAIALLCACAAPQPAPKESYAERMARSRAETEAFFQAKQREREQLLERVKRKMAEEEEAKRIQAEKDRIEIHKKVDADIADFRRRLAEEAAERAKRDAEEMELAKERRIKLNKLLEEQTAARRAAFIEKHPHTRFKQEILEGRVVIGMSTEEVLVLWDKPEKINRTVNLNSVREQWVYGDTLLYFTDGIMAAFQDSR